MCTSVKDHNSAKFIICRIYNLSIINYLPTCTSRLVVQHPLQVSFKSMQRCRSWEDKLKCVKLLSVKGHNSAKNCRPWIISQHALLDLWYNICTRFHPNPCKDVGGVEKTNFDGTEWQKNRMMNKANTLKCPMPFCGGHKNMIKINIRCIGGWYKNTNMSWHSKPIKLRTFCRRCDTPGLYIFFY